MDAIRSLLAATDFSAAAERASRRAALLARELGARFELLHVVSGRAGAGEQAAAEAERLLADLGGRMHADAVRVAVGSPPETILDVADAHDVLVLGSRGANTVREAVLGTTAERLLLRAQRPMLVVKREPEAAYRHLLVPCEYAPPARRALELALRLAPRARITLMHASGEPRESEARTLAWLSGLREGLEGAKGVEAEVRFEKPREAIGTWVESGNADLVVMGKQGRSRTEMILGSVTRHVLSGLDCDVLVAPPGRGP